eukprot:108165_1
MSADREAILSKLSPEDRKQYEDFEKELYAKQIKVMLRLYKKDLSIRLGEADKAYDAVLRRFRTFEKAHPEVKPLDLYSTVRDKAMNDAEKAPVSDAKDITSTAAIGKQYDAATEGIAATKGILKECTAKAIEALQSFEKTKDQLIADYPMQVVAHNRRKTSQLLSGLNAQKTKQDELVKKAKEDLKHAHGVVSKIKGSQSAHMGYYDGYNDYSYQSYGYDDVGALDTGYYAGGARYVAPSHNQMDGPYSGGEYAIIFVGLIALMVVIACCMLICGLVCGVFIGRRYEQEKKRESVDDATYA